LASDIVLLAFGVFLTFQTDPAAGAMAWIIYLPVAIIASVLAGIIARLSAPKGLTRLDEKAKSV
jgi:hypothetical protein